MGLPSISWDFAIRKGAALDPLVVIITPESRMMEWAMRPESTGLPRQRENPNQPISLVVAIEESGNMFRP
jgi:hypothetical protein